MANGKLMTTEVVTTYSVYEYFPSGKSRLASGSFKTFERAYQRLLALQESNNYDAMYRNGTIHDFIVVSNTRRVTCLSKR